MLTLHHDIVSAGSLLAVLRLQRVADEGFHVAFAGLDTLGLEVTVPAMLADVEDWQRHHEALRGLGWDVPRPRQRPPTVRCHVVGAHAEAQGLGAAWRLASYRAHWVDGRDLGDDAVLLELGNEVGLSADVVGTMLADVPMIARARADMVRRRRAGIGGVPILEVDGTFTSPFVPDADLRTLAAL